MRQKLSKRGANRQFQAKTPKSMRRNISKTINSLSSSFKIHIWYVSALGLLISLIRCDKAIKRRIGISKNIFHKMEKVLTSRAVNVSTKLRLLKCYVWSTLLYECESWTISQRMKSQLEATEIWFIRHMLHIAWTDKVSNEEVLQRAQELLFRDKSDLWDTSWERVSWNRLRWLGWSKAKELEDADTLSRGRQRKTFMDWLSFTCGEQWKINDILKIVKIVMNIYWSPTSESDTTLTLDWIDFDPKKF